MRHRVVMVTTSYPRFPGDTIATFVEPIAHGIAERGHDVHVVAPWHPALARPGREDGVRFHFFRYAPVPALNVFGYSGALRADTELRLAAYFAAPVAIAAGWRMARRVADQHDATVLHGHWVVPGGVIAVAAAGHRPTVVSLHGSDVFVAEHHRLAGLAARRVFGRAAWITACSDDLARRAVALGSPAPRTEVLPYGVDATRFRPDPDARGALAADLGLEAASPLLFSAGRFVRKKGFEHLIDAVARLLHRWPTLTLVIAGAGDLDADLRARARGRGVGDRVRFPGVVSQSYVSRGLAAADVVIVPSVHDAAGNVDGLPNVVLEAMAAGAPLVTTPAGGIGAVVEHGRTAVVVAEGDADALAGAVDGLLADPGRRLAIGHAARAHVIEAFGWQRYARRLEQVYDQAVGDRGPHGSRLR
jgi:glycosyltransferase involved in cell wall biosynthesis